MKCSRVRGLGCSNEETGQMYNGRKKNRASSELIHVRLGSVQHRENQCECTEKLRQCSPS